MAGPSLNRKNGLHWPNAEWFQEWERLALHQPVRTQAAAALGLESPFEIAPATEGGEAVALEPPATPEAEPALHEVAADGDAARLQALLEADPGRVAARDDRGLTPLHLAAGKGRKAAVELLLASGSEVNCRDNNGWTPLHWAAVYGHREVAELLLANHADANARDNNGWTPLHWAAGKGHQELAGLLRRNGASE